MRPRLLNGPLILLITLSSTAVVPVAPPEAIATIVRCAAAYTVCLTTICVLQCCTVAASMIRDRRRDARARNTAQTLAAVMERQRQQGPVRAGVVQVLHVAPLRREPGRVGRRETRPVALGRMVVVYPDGPMEGRLAIRGGRCLGGGCGEGRVGRP